MSRYIKDQDGANHNPKVSTLTATGTISTDGNIVAGGSITADTVISGADNGTVTTAATTAVAEYGGADHLTVLTLTGFAVGTSGDAAALAFGAKFYTFPAGSILVESATIVGGLTAAISVTTDTPEVGIGTVVATGAAATLTTATWEDIIDGGAAGLTGGDAIAPDVAGTAFYKGQTFTTGVLIKATGGKARDLFLNVADTWANVTAAGAVTFTGVITLKWRKVD